MVVGNGLLARCFSNFASVNDVTIFASGVSNSQEKDPVEFEKEIEKIKNLSGTSSKFIYFSTVSVHDPDLADSPYIRHKLKIEELIRSEFSRYIVFRLPIVVGRTDNPHTLTNFLFNQIKNHEVVTIFKNACRYLVDIDDVNLLLSGMISSATFDNNIVDINFNNAIGINELVGVYEQVLGVGVNKSYVEKGGCYETRNGQFISYAREINFELSADYIYRVIEKYYKHQF